LYFKCGSDKFFLENGVHQGSPISPALFNIYLEDVLEKLIERCQNFTFWYKVYADDLVIIVKHSRLWTLIKTLYDVSEEFSLRINAKKCAIFAVHGHNKIAQDADLQGIPVTSEYTYLGIAIDESGSIAPQLKRLLQRSKYLKAHLRYYA
jgi:hypothetical protein